MLTLGHFCVKEALLVKHVQVLEPTQFVSEEYCHHALTRSATSGCTKHPPLRNIHSWKQS